MSEPTLSQIYEQLRHDLGNPLTVVHGGAQLLARLIQRSPSLTEVERTRLQRHLAMIDDGVRATTEVLNQAMPLPQEETTHNHNDLRQLESDARLRLALDVAAVGTWSWDLVTGLGSLDARGAAIVGLTPGPLPDVAGAQFASIHPDDLAPVQAAVEAGIGSGEDFDLAYRVIHDDDSVHYVASRARALVDGEGTPVTLLGTNRDVTAERETAALLQQQVAAATLELSALSRRLLLVQEEERRALARELHDEIGQVLTGLQFELAAARNRGEVALAEAEATVKALTEQVRQLSMNLRPPMLDTLGLLPAVQWLVDRFQTQTGIQVNLRHQGIERRFRPEVEIAAYRVVQEALTNVARHAEVEGVMVSLLGDDTLLIVIRDEGRGFDPAITPTTSGLRGLRERVELLGGSVAIESAPGSGARITAEFPFGDPGMPVMVGRAGLRP